ncbi:hypothetical protein K435DRAFT_792803 [Dendrothele bispora CBS 962.96]|uniref:Uncharacterized protein n=1 Tax=Dendrothele bispora (strain CBS 962.96) TaxID=1314807 RepID=A0A4S8MHI4_DENBC|nr:hypothetical protein K435DRAFT_792803 [Dendrothele bispora CBS 962.96]
MDAAELSRWTRFAAKGGIAKCTAKHERVAEGNEGLMSMKDGVSTVLMQNANADAFASSYPSLGLRKSAMEHTHASDVETSAEAFGSRLSLAPPFAIPTPNIFSIVSPEIYSLIIPTYFSLLPFKPQVMSGDINYEITYGSAPITSDLFLSGNHRLYKNKHQPFGVLQLVKDVFGFTCTWKDLAITQFFTPLVNN